ncbi:OmpH family outer membrane protein [Candidatus Thiosymbion oneisti]|uniref:OmpH family outer membrane protein n=1 Tax=Candidatus Thiosymbion oneisti TaxID=589554 RepID=UPI00105B7A30|nr:OmpH family outer membrane protein [Candidatus Thiosymbion oneisti]
MKQRILFILPFLCLLMTPVQAAKPGKIGYVNMQEVIDKSKLGRQAQETLKKKFGDRQQELAKEQQSIQQLQQTFDKDKALMSKKELDKKTAEIRERKKKFQQKVAQLQKEVAQEENKLANRILEPTPAIIAAVAKNKQVSAVFERRQSGLLYIDDGLDLTAEVIKRLNAKKLDPK